MAVSAIVVSALVLTAQEAARTAADDLNALPSERVGAMLAPDLAAPVVHHKASPPHMMSPPPRREDEVATVMLYSAAARNIEGVCRRDGWYVAAERDGEGGFRPVGRRSAQIQLRIDSDCAGATERTFAALHGDGVSTTEAEASRMLVRLVRLRADAQVGRPIGMRVECTTDFSYYTCPAETLPLLAQLPLEGAYAFSRSHDERRDLLLAATETRPGNLFWEIRFSEAPTPTLHLKRRIPPPF